MSPHIELKLLALSMVLLAGPIVSGYEYNPLTVKSLYNQNKNGMPNLSDKEYVQHIHSMINKGNLNSNIFIETNALIDTKYQTLKRNGDLINSLLALPRDMYEAGR